MPRERTVLILMVLVGLVNFAPVVGLLGADRLNQLYGFGTLQGDLLTLMQHRALLFGVLGGFIIYSAFNRHLQSVAMLLALVSMAGFILLVFGTEGSGANLIRVAVVDIVACGLLLIAWLLNRHK